MYFGLCSAEAEPLNWVFIIQNVCRMFSAHHYIQLYIQSLKLRTLQSYVYFNGKLTFSVKYH